MPFFFLTWPSSAITVFMLGILTTALSPAVSCLAAETLSLPQALQLAIRHNPTLQSSREDVKVSEAQHDIALSAFLPRLDVTGTYINTNQPSQAFGILLDQGRFTAADFAINNLNNPGPTDNFKSAVNLTQSVYNGGRDQLNMTLSQLGKTVSTEGLESTRQGVLFDVTRAYLNLVLAKHHLTITREAVEIARANVRQIAAHFKNGVVVKSDILQAQVRLADRRAEAIHAEQVVHVARLALRHAIGVDHEVDTAETLRATTVSSLDLKDLTATALESRPDYRQTTARLQQADLKVDVAQSAYYPQLHLQASYELNNTAPFSSNGSNNYSVFGVLSVNLFHGLKDAAEIRKAKSQADQTRQLLAAKRRAIEVEVVEASSRVISASEELTVTEKTVAQATENLRIVRNRYREGLAPVLDLLTAELVLNHAKRNRMQALYDLRISRARLAFVTGTFQQGVQ